MSYSVLIGTAILLAVSLLVRVAPAFIPLPISQSFSRRLETTLPVAVFINLAVYCAVSEVSGNWIAGLAGMTAVVALFPFVARIGLVAVVLGATVVFLLVNEYAVI